MELVENGELFGLVRDGCVLDEDCIRFLFRRIITGSLYLTKLLKKSMQPAFTIEMSKLKTFWLAQIMR